MTPFLGSTDVITLEIEQEISAAEEEPQQIQSAIAVQALQVGPNTRVSKTTTRVHVPNNYFLIISGMIQDEKTRIRERVPCLGGLPFASAVFRADQNQIRKRNLMIFIRPTIVDTAEEIEEETHRQQDMYRDANIRKDPFKYEIESGLEWLQLRERR